jgi:hypothetical protein
MWYPMCWKTRIQFLTGTGMFFLVTVPGLIVEPTRPPKQLVPRSLSLGLKQLNRTANSSPPSSSSACTFNVTYAMVFMPVLLYWRSPALKWIEFQLLNHVVMSSDLCLGTFCCNSHILWYFQILQTVPKDRHTFPITSICSFWKHFSIHHLPCHAPVINYSVVKCFSSRPKDVCTLKYYLLFLQTLAEQIHDRNEKMKTQMMGEFQTERNCFVSLLDHQFSTLFMDLYYWSLGLYSFYCGHWLQLCRQSN